MANPNGLNPTFDALTIAPQVIQAAAANSSINTIKAGKTGVTVSAVTNDADDWITLPPLASVPVGHTIRIYAGATSNFELRTPASSNEKINAQDSDGTKEYLVTDTHTVVVTKISATNWTAQSITNLGAVATAVVPD